MPSSIHYMHGFILYMQNFNHYMNTLFTIHTKLFPIYIVYSLYAWMNKYIRMALGFVRGGHFSTCNPCYMKWNSVKVLL